jgi:hypothetical protein
MAERDRGEKHPGPAELESFLLGDLPPRQAAPVLAHLMRGCSACQERMAPLASVMFSSGRNLPDPAPEVGAEYDFPLFKAFATARRFAATLAKEQAEDQAEAGRPQEVPVSEPAAPEVQWARDWARCETLLDRSRALRHSDPEGMVLLASLAVSLSSQLDAGTGVPEALADLQARGWAELGNARRIANDPNGAEADLAQALRLASQGTGSPLLLAQLMDYTASVYTAQRRFDESFRLLDWVYAINHGLGETHAAGRALISKGIVAGYALASEESVRLLAQGLALIDAHRDPKLALAAVHSLISFLVEAGHLSLADRLLLESRPLYNAHAERLDVLKVLWLEGRIASGLGDEETAEMAYREVRAGYESVELPYDAALASLDLAAIWLQRGRTSEVKDLVDETVAIFRARNIRREAIAALLMLREALQKEQATVALLRTVASELQRLEREPARSSGS